MLQTAEDDPSGLGQTVSYQMYKMPPGIDNREFVTLKRKIVDEKAYIYEMLSRAFSGHHRCHPNPSIRPCFWLHL